MTRSLNRSPSGRSGRTLLWHLVVVLVICGCATISPGSNIEAVHLFGVPAALDMDGIPGPDGVGVRIYASAAATAKGLPIRSGTLEVLMFDTVAQAANASSTKPRHIWSFDSKKLKDLGGDTSMGLGYRLALPWGPDKPPGHSVTVLARYIPRKGKPIYSSPSTISLTVK